MALNLSTLTSPATSGDVLAEALTTADFLEPVPVLRNLARGSQKGGDAKQDVALNQPKALPLIDGDGYLYLPQVGSNYASIIEPLSMSNAWTIEIVAWVTEPSQAGADQCLLGSADTSPNHTIRIRDNSFFEVCLGGFTNGVDAWRGVSTPSLISNGVNNIVITWNGTDTIAATLNGTSLGSRTLSAPSDFEAFRLGEKGGGTESLRGAYKKLIVTESGSEIVNCDFTATNVRHGDTKFKCATGQVVTINQSGNDPATIIKKPVLRFDGVNDGFKGLFDQTITDGAYMFAAFSVLGSGGDSWGRVFTVNKTSGFDYNTTGNIFSAQVATTGDLAYAVVSGSETYHPDLFDDGNGDILHQVKVTNSAQSSLVNGADFQSKTDTLVLEAQEFNIGKDEGTTVENAAIDLEYLALFPASITDAQADSVRSYINNRNNVFDLKDGFGYYFYDAQSAPVGAISSGSSAWNGRIVGSDNGDTDKLATQATANHQPVGDGFKVTFADNTDHLDIPSTSQAGWQIVGTSLGTFAYRVNANAQVRLNLLGYRGNVSYRKAGDLYGIILLPESATGRDIEQARKLLIDRGAADGASGSDYFAAWFERFDIVEFKSFAVSTTINFNYAFSSMTNLVSFPAMSFPNTPQLTNTWESNTSMSDFGAIQAPLCINFSSAWRGASSLQSFPAGAKLGTEAENVNFSNAWRESGLTSFSTPLPTGNNLIQAWYNCNSLQIFSAEITAGNLSYAWFGCTSLTEFKTTDIKTCSNFTGAWQSCSALQSFPAGAKLGTAANNVNFTSAWQSSGLTSFPALDLSTGTNFSQCWRQSALVSFPSLDLSNNTNFSSTWYGCLSMVEFSLVQVDNATRFDYAWGDNSSLTTFPANFFDNWNPSSISNGVFNNTWAGCNLTAQSVENILVSIDASGKYGTATGASGGGSIDSGIDIDYNVATGSLSAATNSAIDSLSGKGWEVFINGVLVIPNILDLAPAAAYSLRSFDADADPNVVNVRRSSDGATSDFTASEVSDGTLTDWVNTDVDLVTPTLNNGGFEDGLTGWSTGGAVLDTSVAYAGSNSSRFDIISGGYKELTVPNSLQNGNQYKVTFWAKVSDSSATARVDFGSGNLNPVNFSSTDWEYKEVTGVASGSTSFRFARDGGSPVADFTVNFDNVTLTQLTADGHVTTWYDQGGTNHATQTSGSAQPKIVDAGTLVTEGGLAAMDFDGVNDLLEGQDNGSFDSIRQGAFSYFGVAKLDGFVSYASLWNLSYDSQNGGGVPALQFAASSPRFGPHDTWRNANTITEINLPNINNESLFTLTRDNTGTNGNGASVSVYVKDNASGNVSNTGVQGYESLSGTSYYIGAQNFVGWWNGKIKEIVVFNTDQSANRTGIENNINDTYTIY